jgi:hypothetical protein
MTLPPPPPCRKETTQSAGHDNGGALADAAVIVFRFRYGQVTSTSKGLLTIPAMGSDGFIPVAVPLNL